MLFCGPKLVELLEKVEHNSNVARLACEACSGTSAKDRDTMLSESCYDFVGLDASERCQLEESYAVASTQLRPAAFA